MPLGWQGKTDMIKDANPIDDSETECLDCKQTVEFRAPDGSADLYLLMAGLVMAAQYGLKMEDSLKVAENLYVEVNIFKEENKAKLDSLDSLPASCFDSAQCLKNDRELFEADGVFPVGMIDNIISKLKSFDDKDLSERLYGKNEEISELVAKYLHCS